MDRYYCGQRPRAQWVATQLVRRLADPRPVGRTGCSRIQTDEDWATVRQQCLSVAVAMLEETRWFGRKALAGRQAGGKFGPGELQRREIRPEGKFPVPTAAGRVLAHLGDPRRAGQ